MKIQSINPATETLNAEFELMEAKQALTVCKKSHNAFESWKTTDFSEKAALCRKLAGVLRSEKNQCARRMTMEMGKPITQALAEVEKCAWTAELFAEKAAGWLSEETVQAEGKKNTVRYEPMGVVLSIMPWNFPFWQALRFAIPAVMAGNTTVLRHSNVVPLCAQAIGDLFEKAGFPEGVFSVTMTDHAAAARMIASRYVSAVSLTGSENAGCKIGSLAGKHLKKCVLELGGSDPFIVLEDADIEKAAKTAAVARCINSGQSCIAAKRFIVHEKVAEVFTSLFVQEMRSLKVGDPMDSQTQVGPLANKFQRDEVERQVSLSQSLGATALCGGKRPEGKGFFYEPTVLSGITKSMPVWKEEVFGPAAPVLVVKNEKQALRVANDSDLGLGASIWTVNESRAERIVGSLECGVVSVNGMIKSDPRMPFGGIKKSGIGRELGKWGLREFCNIKAVNVYNP